MKKNWSLLLILLSILLLPGTQCGRGKLIKMVKNNRISISPNPVIIHNDSLKLDVVLEVSKSRDLRDKALELDFFLYSSKGDQLLTKKVIPVQSSKGDTLHKESFTINVPLRIVVKERATIELATRIRKVKNQQFYELPRLDIANVFIDSTTYLMYMTNRIPLD